MIKLDIGSLPDGFSHMDLTADASELGVSLEGARFDSPIEIGLDISRRGNEISLKGRARVKAVLECARCLEEYVCALDGPFELWCMIGGERADKAGFGEGESVIELPGGAKYVDLLDHIRSELLVLMPLKPLCKDTCKGLCPKCGANLNISPCTCDAAKGDSRWNILNGLK